MDTLRRYHARVLIIIILLLVGVFAYFNESPSAFPAGTLVTVHSGDSLISVAKDLKAKHLVRSSIVLRGIATLLSGEQKLVAGEYYFGRSISSYGIVSRLLNGNFDLASVRITIPEGISMSQIATILSSKLLDFSVADFMKFSPEKEGYLFPDTYFFLPDAKAGEIIAAMQKNFAEKIKTVQPAIEVFGKPEKDVIIMASILEEEARTTDDWQTISSILWKRIKIGMPLQVDSTVGYALSKANSDLVFSDLKASSTYNTYVNKGLPPTPIANPGLKTILAAATPTTTPYLYYLSDKNGVIHYAATFAEHVKNREKYLR